MGEAGARAGPQPPYCLSMAALRTATSVPSGVGRRLPSSGLGQRGQRGPWARPPQHLPPPVRKDGPAGSQGALGPSADGQPAQRSSARGLRARLPRRL